MRRYLQASGLLAAFLAPQIARAIEFIPSISIPGVATAGEKITITGSTFGEYIVGIYGTSVSVGAILSTIVLLVAGFVWLTAAGNVGQIETAKDIAGGAVSGLALLLLSWVLLNTINPNLVNFKTLEIKTISNEPLNPSSAAKTCNPYRSKPPDTQAYTYELRTPPEEFCGSLAVGYQCYCEIPVAGAVKCCYQKTQNNKCPGVGICFNDVTVQLQGESCPENTESLLRPPEKTCAQYISEQNSGVPECSSCP